MQELLLRFVFVGMSLVLADRAFGQSKPVVVVELFTSEGCSSCPPADAIFRDLQSRGGVDGVELVLLGEHVDYWNHLGWRDSFSSQQFTARQEDYTGKLRVPSAYTPQAVVDGSAEVVGNDEGALRQAIANSAKKVKPVQVSVQWDSASQTAHIKTERANVGKLFVALTEDELTSSVKSGENGGHTLHHSAVVRRLVDTGHVPATGSKDLKVPLEGSWKTANLHLAAFVQDEKTGAILGADTVRIGTQ
jgi:hypothetical protein